MSIELSRPGVLYLLLLIPVWWAVAWPREGWGVLFARGEEAGPVSGRWGGRSAGLLLLPRLLRSGAMALVVLALAGPQRVEVVDQEEPRGKAVGLALDLSSSMLAEDMQEGLSRMEAARTAAVRFAEGRPHDEISVVAFAGEALTRVPPTADGRVVRDAIESLDVYLLSDGSDIATGLLAAVEQVLTAEPEDRVVVLLSDGAHNGYRVPLLAAARAAASVGVRVHGISIPGPAAASVGGLALGAPPAGRGGEGGGRALAAVAALTGGRYYQASSVRALEAIYAEIDRLEAPTREPTERTVRRPLRASALLLGLLLLGAEGLLRGSRWGVVP